MVTAVQCYTVLLQAEEIVREQLEELIINYRENPDLQNLIDSIQADVSTTTTIVSLLPGR